MIATVGKESRAGKPIGYNDYVRIRGYFCQLFSYSVQLPDGRSGTATIPLLVGDAYELLSRPKAESAWGSGNLPLLGALGAFAVAAVVLLQGRSRSRFQRRRLEARRESRTDRQTLPQDLEVVDPEPPAEGASDHAEERER
jgi:hypothetical protein